MPQVTLVPPVGAEVDKSASEALRRSVVAGDVLRDVKAFESENPAERLEFVRRADLFEVCSGEVERLCTVLPTMLFL
jgi:hypothetical protein